jgi:gamma-D-glutamyl-L-lysine dipeptidyl-peptidase
VVTGGALLAAGCGTAPTLHSDGNATGRSTSRTVVVQPAALTAGTHVWVCVAVATLWTSTSAPRLVDAPALSAPVHIRRWLAAMSTAARRGLTGRVETQALYGEPLTVVGTSGIWLHVVAPTQRTHRDSRGYPGWIPRRQVTTHAPTKTTYVATVTSVTAWLRNTSGARVVEVSLGTRLPVLSSGATTARVATPTGGIVVVRRSNAVVRVAAARALALTRTGLVATAKRFLSVPYLWGGRSGFAVDCSGLTNLVYGQHGIGLARDTDDQSRAGVAVPLGSTRAGDLAFYGPRIAPTHVAMYVSSSVLIHAPSAGRPVRLVTATAMAKPATVRRMF